jgi:cytochrome c oxidase subunit II
VRAIVFGIVGAVLGCILGLGMAAMHVMPTAASVQAQNTDWLFNIMLVITGAIFGLVTMVLVVSVFKFRERRGETRTARPTHGHTQLEIVWTAIPLVIVSVIAGLAWSTLNANDNASGAWHIDVIGQQWDWNYAYPQAGLQHTHQLVVPVNQKIQFAIASRDVIHGWWVPSWRVSMNATPGQTNLLVVTPTKIGSFKVVCNFICGTGHPIMGTNVQGSAIARILVVSRADYNTWLAKQLVAQKQAAANPTTHAVAIFNQYGCSSCHAWTPAGAAGHIGPNLDNVAADAAKAGRGSVATYIHESIVNPSAYTVPGYPNVMPPGFGTHIPPADLTTLVNALAGGSK